MVAPGYLVRSVSSRCKLCVLAVAPVFFVRIANSSCCVFMPLSEESTLKRSILS
jgi:hypothetical protein